MQQTSAQTQLQQQTTTVSEVATQVKTNIKLATELQAQVGALRQCSACAPKELKELTGDIDDITKKLEKLETEQSATKEQLQQCTESRAKSQTAYDKKLEELQKKQAGIAEVKEQKELLEQEIAEIEKRTAEQQKDLEQVDIQIGELYKQIGPKEDEFSEVMRNAAKLLKKGEKPLSSPDSATTAKNFTQCDAKTMQEIVVANAEVSATMHKQNQELYQRAAELVIMRGKMQAKIKPVSFAVQRDYADERGLEAQLQIGHDELLRTMRCWLSDIADDDKKILRLEEQLALQNDELEKLRKEKSEEETLKIQAIARQTQREHEQKCQALTDKEQQLAAKEELLQRRTTLRDNAIDQKSLELTEIDKKQNARATELDEQGRKLEAEKMRLDQMVIKLRTQQEQQNATQQQLTAQSEALLREEKSLEQKKAALAQERAALETQQAAIAERTRALAERTRAIAAKEQVIAAKEQEVEGQEKEEEKEGEKEEEKECEVTQQPKKKIRGSLKALFMTAGFAGIAAGAAVVVFGSGGLVLPVLCVVGGGFLATSALASTARPVEEPMANFSARWFPAGLNNALCYTVGTRTNGEQAGAETTATLKSGCI